jgi:hypothetical protein
VDYIDIVEIILIAAVVLVALGWMARVLFFDKGE